MRPSLDPLAGVNALLWRLRGSSLSALISHPEKQLMAKESPAGLVCRHVGARRQQAAYELSLLPSSRLSNNEESCLDGHMLVPQLEQQESQGAYDLRDYVSARVWSKDVTPCSRTASPRSQPPKNIRVFFKVIYFLVCFLIFFLTLPPGSPPHPGVWDERFCQLSQTYSVWGYCPPGRELSQLPDSLELPAAHQPQHANSSPSTHISYDHLSASPQVGVLGVSGGCCGGVGVRCLETL